VEHPPWKIVVPDDMPPVLAGTEALTRLQELGEVNLYGSRAESSEELIRRIAEADVVINIRAHTLFTEEVLRACPHLRLISIWGVGTDNIDLEAAEHLGIAVTNTPGANATAVAEHTLALILALARRLPQTDREVRQGGWPRAMAVQLQGKVLGIIGLGAIGRQVAGLGKGIGMEVIAWTFHPSDEMTRRLGIRMVPLEELLKGADVISIHVRLSPQSEGLIGERELRMMKPTAFLVNTARGKIVDQTALVKALREGWIAGAALDVFEVEPLPPDNPLKTLDNVILTPHSASMTKEAIEGGLLQAVENIKNFLAGTPTNLVVPRQPPRRRTPQKP